MATTLADAESDRILAMHEALTQLEAESPRKAQLVKLRFVAGMTLEEAAGVLRIGRSLAYQLAGEYDATSGVSGLPVIRLG